jgi:hypothetical protein
VTVLVSSDKQEAQIKADGKSGEAKPAVSKRAKRGGAAQRREPRRGASKAAAVRRRQAEEKPQKKASKGCVKAGRRFAPKKKADE